MEGQKEQSFATRALHCEGHEKPLKSHAFPIFQTSTFYFDSPDEGAALFGGQAQGHMYSRLGNPTVECFEKILANLEEGNMCIAFASGMAAVTGATLPFLKAGDHVILGDTLYGPSIHLMNDVYTRWGIQTTVVNTGDVEAVRAALKKNTRIIYLETPANPTNKISDIAAISRMGHEFCGALTVVDNTFTTPYFQRPLTLGADICMHSLTKYLNGHGDVVAGAVIAKTRELGVVIASFRKDTGGIMSPLDAFLVTRGIRTLACRMETLNRNGMAVAKFLRSRSEVELVMHPMFEDFPNHDVAEKQMTGYGSTFSFNMHSFEAAKKLLERVHLCTVAVSLGGVDTLIEHPASMTHRGVPVELMRQQGLTPSLVRISIGLEDPKDIIADLAHALEGL